MISYIKLAKYKPTFITVVRITETRAACMITDNHTLYPYNTFTLSQCDNGHDISDYKTMSEVFREIALKIFEEEDRNIEEDEIVGSLKKIHRESNTTVQVRR